MVVVDASVAYKWFNQDETLSSEATNIFEKHIRGEVEIAVPSLIFYELANVWATRTELEAPQIENNINDLERANFTEVAISFTFMKKVVQFSKEYKVSAYDACYAVLAEEKECNLVTADDKFADKVNLPFIKKLSESIV